MERFLCLLAGYFCGCIQSGYLFARGKNIDIRNYGSHGTGATNVQRVLGTKAGLFIFFMDFLKGFIPCLLTFFFFARRPEIRALMMMWTAAGVVIGHDFPFWLKGKGGKGIAATAGVMMAIDPFTAILCICLFLLVTAIGRYVSLGSISAMVLLGILLVGNCLGGKYNIAVGYRTEFILMGIFIPALAVIQHRTNIVRLFHKTENKLNLKKKDNGKGSEKG